MLVRCSSPVDVMPPKATRRPLWAKPRPRSRPWWSPLPISSTQHITEYFTKHHTPFNNFTIWCWWRSRLIYLDVAIDLLGATRVGNYALIGIRQEKYKGTQVGANSLVCPFPNVSGKSKQQTPSGISCLSYLRYHTYVTVLRPAMPVWYVCCRFVPQPAVIVLIT